MYLPLKTGASYTYPPTVVFLSLRASKSELEDVVFLVEWLGANYKLYSEVSYNLSTFLGFPFVLRSILCMVCGHEGPGVPSNVPVTAKLLELRVFFVFFFVRVYLQLVVIVYSFLLLYCLLSFWCHHRCVMLRNLSSFLV